jgi:hypothetical protein
MMLGAVDRVDGHYIATKFLGLLLPTESMYVTGESSERYGNVTRFTWSGVPVKLNWKSVALAYPRVWLPFLVPAWPFVMHWGKSFDAISRSTLLTMAAMVVATVLAHLAGRLPEREKARLRVLGQATGLNLDPSKLHPITRMARSEAMADRAEKLGLPTTLEALQTALPDLPGEALPLLYAVARYAGDDAAWRGAAAAVLARIEKSGG